MRLSSDKVRHLAHSHGESLAALLRRAGVSRTAYYSLLRRESVLPKTVLALSAALGVAPGELLDSGVRESEAHVRRLRQAQRIIAREPEAEFDNVWHTLVLLELPPAERLNRSLIRGRAASVHR